MNVVVDRLSNCHLSGWIVRLSEIVLYLNTATSQTAVIRAAKQNRHYKRIEISNEAFELDPFFVTPDSDRVVSSFC